MLSSKRGYAALRLHSRDSAAWAVISLSTGAIATDIDNRLLMRLTEAEANRIAVAMTEPERQPASADQAS